MKTILMGSAFVLGSFMLTQKTEAQVRVGVNINIGQQPSWRDTRYDYVEYYYLPDIQSYYYVPTRQFIYLSGNRWIFSASLPSRYRSYNLHTGYKVVVNRPNAYNYFEDDRRRYSPRNNWRYNNHHDNGRHRGHRRHDRF